MWLGDQRVFVAQLEKLANKRRERRPSVQKVEPKLPKDVRVKHVLSTGKIIDYTHPSEVDPYWDKLYRQFEYLQYLTDYYKACVAKSGIEFTDEQIQEIMKDIQLMKKYRSMYMKYLLGGLQMLYGSVMSKKFYGWFHSIQRFIERFNSEAISTLSKLRFDPDRTRCSVYFYQVFWLSGLAVKNEISAELNPDFNDNISVTDEKLRGGTRTPLDESYARWSVDVEDKLIAKLDGESGDLPDELKQIIHKLLAEVGLTVTSLNNDKTIQSVAMTIRKKLRTGDIKLDEHDRRILRKYNLI